MILLDSNIVIYASKNQYPQLWLFLEQHALAISELTRIEVLGFHRISVDEKKLAAEFLTVPTRFKLEEPVIEWAICLRQQKSMRLGDAIIAATALCHQLPLATHNIRDFDWIKNLDLIDPLQEA